MQSQAQMQETEEATKRTAIDPLVLASGASVVLSWYYFYVKEDREQGLFVGLWPPTFLAFASYFRQSRMHSMLESSPTGVMGRVQQAIRERQ